MVPYLAYRARTYLPLPRWIPPEQALSQRRMTLSVKTGHASFCKLVFTEVLQGEPLCAAYGRTHVRARFTATPPEALKSGALLLIRESPLIFEREKVYITL